MKKLLLLPLIVLVACNPCKRLQKKCPTQDSISYVETVTEDPYYTIPDSVFWQLEFECDSNYQVLLRDFEEANTGLQTEVEVREVVRWREDKTQIKRLQIDLSVVSDSIMMLNKTIEKLHSEQKTVFVDKEIAVPTKYIPKVYKWALQTMILIVIVLAGYVYVRIKYGSFKDLKNKFLS